MAGSFDYRQCHCDPVLDTGRQSRWRSKPDYRIEIATSASLLAMTLRDNRKTLGFMAGSGRAFTTVPRGPRGELQGVQRRYDLSAHQVDVLQHLNLGHLRVEQRRATSVNPFRVGGDLLDALLGATHQEGVVISVSRSPVTFRVSSSSAPWRP